MKNLRVLMLKGLSALKNNGSRYVFYKFLRYMKTRKNFNYYMKEHKISEDEIEKQKKHVFENFCKFSIVVPLYNTPEKLLCEMIESVIHQTYLNWELCIADGSDKNIDNIAEVCKRYLKNDKRIKYIQLNNNYGIAGNTNKCIEMATGEYIALFDHDDLLHPSALFENMLEIEKNNADFLYSDELVFTDNPQKPLLIHFKPDFSIDNLRANNYICHFTVFKKALLDNEAFFRSEYDGSQDYDIILRLTEKAKKIVHIKKVLYFWRSHPGSVASDISVKSYCLDAAKKALNAHLFRVGLLGNAVDSPAISTYKINYKLKNDSALVSVIIPFEKDFDALTRCLKSLRKSLYKNFEVNIVYSETLANEVIEKIQNLNIDNIKYKTIKYPNGYNYADMCNYISYNVLGEYILFLEENQYLLSEKSMMELLMYAQRSDVGVVGSKLYNDRNQICHAGIIFGKENTITLNGYGVHKDNLGYMGRLSYAQNISAVLVQGMMVKKDDFNKIGKFNKELNNIMCGVELSLKLMEKGYLNVFTPFSEFVLTKNIKKDCYKINFALNYEEKYYTNLEYLI